MPQVIAPSKPGESFGEISAFHALVVVARRLGVDISYGELARSYAANRGEPKNATLVAIARDIGLEAKVIDVKFRDLPKLSKSLPAIIRVNNGAALVLESAKQDPQFGNVAVVRDPTRQDEVLTTVNQDQLERVWEGQVIVLKRKYATTDEEQPFGVGWLIGQVLREGALFRDIGIAALISTVFAIAPAFMFRIVLDRVLANQSYSTLYVLAGALALMILFETVLLYYRRRITEVATLRIDSRINLHLMSRLLKLPLDYFERTPTGKTMSKIGRIWAVRNFLTGPFFTSILDAVPLVGLVPVLFILQWRLAIFVMAMALIVFLVILAFIKPLGRLFTHVVRAEHRRATHLTETIYGMRTIKSLVIEGRRRREWDERIAATMDTRFDLGSLAAWPSTLTLPFERLMYSGSFCLGAFLALQQPDTMTAGALGAFAMLSMRLGGPLIAIARLQLDLTEVRGAISEVAELLNTPAEDTRELSGMRPEGQGRFEFKDVSFRYSQGAPFALDGINLVIPAGCVLGVMGRSGSGKSTIARLLQRLHSNYEGQIKLDGVDLREYNLAHLRSSLGVVLQDNFLFAGTIRENISMARPDASMEQIIRAAQLAGAEEFIERFPRGYDTMLEEGAANLSGGQRQRLAIARALLTDPRVLILDEATSALDAESEAIVNANLRRIGHGRTVISISHRLSMLVDADAILVLERGKVYDIGTHEELLERCDIYKQLWYQQNRHAERSDANAAARALGRG